MQRTTVIDGGAGAVGTTSASAARSARHRTRRLPELVALGFFRTLLIVPFVLMEPEVFSVIAGRSGAMARLSASTADVLGTSALLILVMMLAVTPVQTLTGWRWHLVLRRDYGIAMFAVAATDLTLAAISTGDTFPGTVLTRIAGHSFLLAGTVSVMLLVPLVLTANRRAQRWLGRSWKWFQRLTYVVWATVLLHLLLLFGAGTIFIDALAVSVPLVLLRVPAVRRHWRAWRRERTHRWARAGMAAVLIGIFVVGYVPLAQELAAKGTAAFSEHPGGD